MSSHGADDHGKAHGHSSSPVPVAVPQVCRCGLTPWPMVMTCACMVPAAPAHDAHHDEPEKPKPKPPTFGSDVPTAVQEGLRAAWLGLEAGRPAIGIIADCERVLTLMLSELDEIGKYLKTPKEKRPCVFLRVWRAIWGEPVPPPPTEMAVRIEALIKKGLLLPSIRLLVEQASLGTLKLVNAGAPLGSPSQAEAFLHLALMIAEQGFAHPQWARTRQRPPQWP